MTYASLDISTQNASPIHLFEFVRGSNTYRFTDLATDIVALSQTWSSAGLISGSIIQSRDLNKDILDIRFPRSNAFAYQYLNDIQDEITSLTIYRGYENDPDSEFITYWKGRIQSAQVSGNLITLECEPIQSSLRRPGLRARYSRLCRHAHYGRGCGLDPDDSAWLTEDVIASVNDLTLEIAAASMQSDGWYSGGMLRAPDGSLRFIREHQGYYITISKAHDELIVGASVKLYPGCDLLPETCRDKFNNLDNHGGFPYMPSRNPFDGSSII